MSPRVLFGAALLSVSALLVVAGIASSRGPDVWTIQLHESMTLPASAIQSDNIYRCEGVGVVDGTPAIGTAELGGGGSFYVAHVVDGTVDMSCEYGADWAMT